MLLDGCVELFSCLLLSNDFITKGQNFLFVHSVI